MDNKNIIVLVIVIALIALFAFQTYSRMKKRVDSENKQFEEMQKKERREAVEKVIRERKEQFEQEEKLKQAQAEGDIEDVAVILPKPELTKMIKMRTAKIIMKIMQIKMILQQPTKANTQYIRMITNI